MNDPIERQAAIKTVRTMYERCDTLDMLDYCNLMLTALKELPSAQPEPCEDAVSREAVSSWLKQYGQDVLHGKYKFSLMYIWKNLMDLPSAQPEIVRCKNCKYWHREIYNNIEYFNYSSCDLNHGGDGHNFYCAAAERNTDE